MNVKLTVRGGGQESASKNVFNKVMLLLKTYLVCSYLCKFVNNSVFSQALLPWFAVTGR